jgi:signal transduction histidine kinase
MEREQELRDANRDLIVGLAHDLRTPLTALTTYVQVMQSGVCGDEAKRDYYLDKIMAKAVQMKELSDRLFECSQVGEEKDREKAEEPMLFQSVFIDSLSEMAMFLEGQGFEVEACLEWKRAMIRVRMDYISRIVDNLGMNLVKYADSDETVRISTVYEPGWAGIEVCNRIKRQGEPVVSTKIGMGNVRAMMGDMWGRCEEEVGEGRYWIRVLFPAEGI